MPNKEEVITTNALCCVKQKRTEINTKKLERKNLALFLPITSKFHFIHSSLSVKLDLTHL